MADHSGAQVNYSDIYATFYVPCLAGTFDGYASNWVGIGGYYTDNLVQTGTLEHRYKDILGRWVDEDDAWVENLGDTSNSNGNTVFAVACNDHMYTEVSSGNCMFVEDYNSGNNGDQCYGPAADAETAEGIVERPKVNNVQTVLADFQSWTLYDVNVQSTSGTWDTIGNFPHDYSTMWSGTRYLISIGSISSGGNYTMQWLHSS